MDYNEALNRLRSRSNPKNLKGMGRYGINTARALGVNIPYIRDLGKEIGTDHQMAKRLWGSGVHEARILATIIDDIDKVSEKQMDKWMADFNSWDICDQTVFNLFWRVPNAQKNAILWTDREPEFERRAGFAMMAKLALSDKKMEDVDFEPFFEVIIKRSDDERNFVKKSVNWALRQIGKRNIRLNERAVKTAKDISERDDPIARWIGKDALRELTSEKTQKIFG